MRLSSLGLWGALSLVLTSCGGDDAPAGVGDAGAMDGGALDAAGDAASSHDGATEAGARDAGTAVDAGMITCRASQAAALISVERGDAGRARSWLPLRRVLQVGPTLLRALVQEAGEAPQVVTFDPTRAAPVTRVDPLPLDVVLATLHEAGALHVYGVRAERAGDAGASGADGGVPAGDGGVLLGGDAGVADAGVGGAELALVSIEDATGAVSSRTLTAPGTVAALKAAYEPVQGRFVRFGDGVVYFTYTEELGSVNNPSYRLSLGHSAGPSDRANMVIAGTAGPHAFQDITAAALVHAGTNVFMFTGASAMRAVSDAPDPAVQWVLPEDGTFPATIPKRGLGSTLLAAARDGARFHFAFVEPWSDVFGDPRGVSLATADEATLASFTPRRVYQVSNSLSGVPEAEAHFEGDQLLWFVLGQGLWLDGSGLRAKFVPPAIGTIRSGTATFATPPTASGADLHVVFQQGDGPGRDSVYYARIACTP